MNRDDRFDAAIIAAATVFGKEMSDAMLNGYRMGLDGLTIDEIERGVACALRECKFMPKPSEIRERASGSLVAAEDRAIIAWGELERAVVVIGGGQSVTFDDPFTTATVRKLGGWIKVCDTPPKEFDVFLRKDFMQIYKSLVSSGYVTKDDLKPLGGEMAQENAAHGYDLPEPRRIITDLPEVSDGQKRIGSKEVTQEITDETGVATGSAIEHK